MEEESKNDKYIICSKCKCKYIIDEEHISTDFGYTRLEERYKTCKKCRAISKISGKIYYDNHKGKRKEYSNKYKEEHKEETKAYDILIYLDKKVCPNCNREVVKHQFAKHQRTQKCKSNVKPIENETTPSEPSTVDTNIYNKQNRVTIHEDNDTSDDENDITIAIMMGVLNTIMMVIWLGSDRYKNKPF